MAEKKFFFVFTAFCMEFHGRYIKIYTQNIVSLLRLVRNKIDIKWLTKTVHAFIGGSVQKSSNPYFYVRSKKKKSLFCVEPKKDPKYWYVLVCLVTHYDLLSSNLPIGYPLFTLTLFLLFIVFTIWKYTNYISGMNSIFICFDFKDGFHMYGWQNTSLL